MTTALPARSLRGLASRTWVVTSGSPRYSWVAISRRSRPARGRVRSCPERPSSTGSEPSWPRSSRSAMCWSYSSCETTFTWNSISEWYSPQSSAHLPWYVPSICGREHVGVVAPRDHVLLVEERRDPERVDDVARLELEPDVLAHREVHRGDVLLGGAAGVADLLAGLVDVLVEVVEVPRPALADDLDGLVDPALVLGGDDRLVAGGEEEEHAHHEQRDDRVHHLQRQVVAELHRQAGVGLAPAVGRHAPDHQAPGDAAHDQRRDPGPVPQVDDPRRLVGHARLARQVPGAQLLGRAPGGDERHQACHHGQAGAASGPPRGSVVGVHVGLPTPLGATRGAPPRGGSTRW